MQTFQPNFSHRTYRHHCLLLFYTTVVNLDISFGSQGQGKAKLIGFVFMHFSQMIRMKFLGVVFCRCQVGLGGGGCVSFVAFVSFFGGGVLLLLKIE